MAQRTGKSPGSGPRETGSARFVVAGRAAGMAADQVPVPERSVRLGRVTVSGPRADAEGDRAPGGEGIDSPSVVRTTAGEAHGAAHRIGATVAEPARGRVRRKAVPFLGMALCAVLVGVGMHQAPGGTHARPAPAAAADTTVLSPGEERGRGDASGPLTPTGPDASAGAPRSGAAPTEPPTSSPAPAPATREVVLTRGDTLWELARYHHTTVRTLQELNGLGDSTLIYAGATLRVPAAAAETSVAASAADTTGETVPARYADDIRSGAAGDTPGPASGPGSPYGSWATPEAGPGALGIHELPKDGKSPGTKPGSGTKNNQDRDEGGKDKDNKTDAGRGATAAVAFARAQIGKPYAWGAAGPGSFDCSGLVMRAWQAGGVQLSRTTWGMRNEGTKTTRENLLPGDLVITNGGGHVQLYLGDGKVIHAPGAGKHVTVTALTASHVVEYRHITARK
ncbi:NlpC/P60 family protein [Kitasatospora aburaviensis]|uniref:NlpC/P60 family protein n=1 Tax=Kitasatospora aburaviensis TaxID=67265 RepID=A0ABW1F1V5_9ACTN